MFKNGERVVFSHRPKDIYIACSVDNRRNILSAFPADGVSTIYTNVSQNLFMSERVYLRDKKIRKLCSKLETL